MLQLQEKLNSVSWYNTAVQTVQFILFVRFTEEELRQEVMLSAVISRWMHAVSTIHCHPFVYLVFGTVYNFQLIVAWLLNIYQLITANNMYLYIPILYFF